MPRQEFLERLLPMLEEPEVFLADFKAGAAAGRLPERKEFVFARPRRRIMRRDWTPVCHAQGEGFLVTWHDVTAERDLLLERERQLLVDALTGIPNRRAADAALRTELERMKRTGTPLCVALFDVDHFKRVNDTHGHGVGDEVLKVVAAALAGQARLTDTVARWGGEEFVAILNVPLDGARTFCERARAAVEALSCPPVERITISIGVAELAAGESTADALGRADQMLYAAKREGRNRVRG